jgi:hypothetical protein
MSGREEMRLATAVATSPAMLPALENRQATGVEDITVTAQKREQNLQVVPISITAITSASIVANRIQDVRDSPRGEARASNGPGCRSHRTSGRPARAKAVTIAEACRRLRR